MKAEFSIGRIPIRVHPSFFFLVLLLSQGTSSSLAFMVEWVVVVFVSVLWHELGHATVAKLCGLEPRIDLHGMGGTSSWSATKTIATSRRVAITLAGPFAGFLVGGLVFLVSRKLALPAGGIGARTVRDLLWVNVGWGVMNMLPMLPLDGGNVMSAIFKHWSQERGEKMARLVSMVFAASAGLWAAAAGWWWPAILGGLFAFQNFQAFRALNVADQDAGLEGDFERARAAWRQNDGATLVRVSLGIAQRAVTIRARAEALILLAYGNLFLGRTAAAREALAGLPPGLGADPQLVGAILIEEDKPEEAIAPLREAVSVSANDISVRLLALALTKANRGEELGALARDTPLDGLTVPGLIALQNETFEAAQYEASTSFGASAFSREKSVHVALNVARSYARLGRVEDAVEWVRKGMDAGLSDASKLDGDADFESLRTSPGYAALRAGMRGTEGA